MSKISKVVKFERKSSIDTNIELLKRLKFGLHSYRMVTEDGRIQNYCFIVIREKETGIILEFTPYTQLLRYATKTIDTREYNTIRKLGVFICTFLNYVLIDQYEKFQIDDLRDITIDHGNAFLEAYARGEIGGKEKTLATIEEYAYRLSALYSNIKNFYKKEAKNIYQYNFKNPEWQGYSENNNNRIKKYKSYFKIKVNNPIRKGTIFRDMPEEIFWIMLNLSKLYYPELTFAIALQAFAGLRPGEVCNVRQAIDPKSAGVKYRRNGTKLTLFEINLNNHYSLRSDLKDVGGIKKKRSQQVYTPYLPIVDELYKEHMKILNEYELEDGYYPMFVNRDGKALMVNSYREKIHRLINHYLRDELLKSDNPMFRHYGQLLTTNRLSPHFLRHFFTVRLVLDNVQPTTIAWWRGDNSLDTALVYCANKEELRNAIYNSNSKIAKEILNYKF